MVCLYLVHEGEGQGARIGGLGEEHIHRYSGGRSTRARRENEDYVSMEKTTLLQGCKKKFSGSLLGLKYYIFNICYLIASTSEAKKKILFVSCNGLKKIG